MSRNKLFYKWKKERREKRERVHSIHTNAKALKYKEFNIIVYYIYTRTFYCIGNHIYKATASHYAVPPPLHLVHSVAPYAFDSLPLSQGMQYLVPVVLVYVFGGQGEHVFQPSML